MDVGDRDVGDRDVGDRDVGDRDVGDRDVGDRDVGDRDVGDRDDAVEENPVREEEIWDDDIWEELGARRSPRRGGAEGVRILGAEEAEAAFESGQVSRRQPGDRPRFGDVPTAPAGPRPGLRFPGDDPMTAPKPPVSGSARSPQLPDPDPYVDRSFWDEPGGAAGDLGGDLGGDLAGDLAGDLGGDLGEPTGSMPHWTEPPSGEVPRILTGDDSGEGDDLHAWSSLAARPRWRDQPNDWDATDFDETILGDESDRLGALRVPTEAAPFSFDDEPEVPEMDAGQPEGGSPRTTVRTRPPRSPMGGPGAPPTGPPGMGGPGREDSRDVSTRVVTGAIAGAVVLLAAILGPGALCVLIGAALVMAVAEFYQALRSRGYHPATLLGLVATASIVAGVYWRGEVAISLVLALFMVFALLWYLTGVVRDRPAANVAVTTLAFLYVGFLGSFAALILRAGDDGIGVLLGAILATVANDIGAYFVGRSFGRSPLAPAVSPNKTVEGAIGAMLVTFVVCLGIVRLISPWDGGRAFWLAAVVSVVAPLGDLCESMIKRDLGVKDMGSFLPGHGGILDRIDALLFVIPATYYLLLLLAS